MRTNEERLAALHKRADEIENTYRIRRNTILQVASLAAGLVLVILMALAMPRYVGLIDSETASNIMSASIFSDSWVIGYIVIAVIAFLLGISVTIFAFRLKRMGDGDKHPREKQ